MQRERARKLAEANKTGTQKRPYRLASDACCCGNARCNGMMCESLRHGSEA